MSTKSLRPDLLAEHRYSWVSKFEVRRFVNQYLTKEKISYQKFSELLSSDALVEGYHWKIGYQFTKADIEQEKELLFHQYRMLDWFLIQGLVEIEETLLANG